MKYLVMNEPEPAKVVLNDRKSYTVSLVAKGPDCEASHFRLLWRRVNCEPHLRKNVLTDDDNFFDFKGTIALRLLTSAEKGGLLEKKKDRWQFKSLVIKDSLLEAESDFGQHLASFVSNKELEERRYQSGSGRIVALREPSAWWRVMLFCRDDKRVSFRAIKEPPYETQGSNLLTSSGWLIHPILMDADTAVHRHHLAVLRDELG